MINDKIWNVREMTEEEFRTLAFGEFHDHHDEVACNALAEYERECNLIEARLSPGQLIGGVPGAYAIMKRIASEHNVAIEEMKKHWRCHETKTKQ
jgi:hypothetical protein